MNSDSKAMPKWIPGLTMLGAALMVAASILHPVVIDPWNAEQPIRFIAQHRMHWMLDHGLMSAAVVLWLGGMAICYQLRSCRRVLSSVVSALFIASLAMWLITLAFELGGIPIAVDRLTEHSNTAQRALSESLFAGALISGYFAMIPAWLGVAVGARSNAGRLVGIIGAAGIAFTLIKPNLWILLLTTAFPFLWTVRYAWHCFKNRGNKSVG